jgi:hypothetical protein
MLIRFWQARRMTSAREDLTWWLFQSGNLADERADRSAKKWALWQEIPRCKTNPLGTRTRLIRSWCKRYEFRLR